MRAIDCANYIEKIADKIADNHNIQNVLDLCAIDCAADYASKSSQYKGDKSVSVIAQNPKKDNYNLTAIGPSVAFMEFGAGVTFQQPYPTKRPAGIVDIGQYGHGNGAKPFWRFEYGGKWVTTKGNPPFMSLYNAGRKAIERITQAYKDLLL